MHLDALGGRAEISDLVGGITVFSPAVAEWAFLRDLPSGPRCRP